MNYVVAQAYLTQTYGSGLQGVYIDHYDYVSPTLIIGASNILTKQVYQRAYYSDPVIYADRVVKIVFVGSVGGSNGAKILCNAFYW